MERLRIFEEHVRVIEQELIKIRRNLHMWPETGLTEERTTNLIVNYLEKWQVSYKRLKPTGVIAWLGNGQRPVVGLRADIDALALTEQSETSYSSKREGYMHGCGHDAHTAGLLGAVYGLKQMEGSLKGTIKFIFQPAEEICKGANLVMDSGMVDDVEKLLGLHVFADIPYGKISIEPGPVMAQTDRFEIRLYGKGGHAAKPQQCVDATVMAAALILNLQTIVSRQMNPVDTAVLTVGSLKSGSQYNIISGEAVMEGTVRSFCEDTTKDIFVSMRQMVEHTAKLYGGEGELIVHKTSHPPLINNEEIVKEARDAMISLFGANSIFSAEKLMLGEDFSNYQKKIPSAFGFIGGGRKNEKNYPNHHPKFDIDERSIGLMAKCYGAFALKNV